MEVAEVAVDTEDTLLLEAKEPTVDTEESDSDPVSESEWYPEGQTTCACGGLGGAEINRCDCVGMDVSEAIEDAATDAEAGAVSPLGVVSVDPKAFASKEEGATELFDALFLLSSEWINTVL